jgi:subtilase family serine protease
VFNRVVSAGLAAAALAAAPIISSGATAQPSPQGQAHSARVCASPVPGFAACDALIRTDINHSSTSAPAGYRPADLQSAYNLGSALATFTGNPTVAIVDAYNDPNAQSDLNTYRAQFGLGSCNAPCFTKINQSGGLSPLPRNNGSWSQEISLDLDMVSAICPKCHILLVEASSASISNLGAAVKTAAKLGAIAISNSYGGSDLSDLTYGANYNQPGVAVTASSGDNGYGTEYPASSGYVTAVGGTHLTGSIAAGWSESAWSGAGSGCSVNPKPTWQKVTTPCSGRAEADVSADADPSTGVSVYDSYSYGGYSGWLEFGGTSVASPIIASVYALAGGEPAGQTGAVTPYLNASNLNDVTSGSNGSCGTAVCNAAGGWDGPTGLGTPNGIGAF